MASIQDLRELFGGESDAETIDLASRGLGLSPVKIADELGFGSTGGKNTQRMSASVDRYQAGLYGTGEALAGAVGLTGARDYMSRQRRSNEVEAQIASERARSMGAVDSWSDVHGVRDFGDYAVGLGIQSLPYAGEAVVGGLTGGIGAARLGLTGASAINRARTAGAAVASYPSSVGDILQSQREQSGGQTDLLSAAGLGIPYVAANVLPGTIEGSLARGHLFRNPIAALDDISGVKGGLARMGATAGKTAAIEGASETFQEGMNQFGRMAVDPSEAFFNPESNERFLEAGIGGATLGGILGGGAGGWRRSQTYTNNQVNLLPDAVPFEQQGWEQQGLPGFGEGGLSVPLTPATPAAPVGPDPNQMGFPGFEPSVNINPNAAQTPIATGNVAANPPTQPAAGKKQPHDEPPVSQGERQAANDMYRTEAVLDDGTEEGHWRVFGKDFFKRSDLNKALDKQAIEDRGDDPNVTQLAKQINAAGPAFPRPKALKELASSLAGSTPEKTAYNLDAAIAGGHKEAERLAAVYEEITGKESPAWQKSKEPAKKPTAAPKPQPEKKPESKPQPAPVATQPKVEFADDDVEGMARATLMKLFNGSEVNVEVALADLRGDKPADIQKQYGVSDSQVRKIRSRLAPKALEIAARQAGVPLEKLQAAFAKKDAVKELQGEEAVLAPEPAADVDEKPMDSDERPLVQVADEELTQEQQEADTFATTGGKVKKGSATQIADASEKNNSRAKLEKANGKLNARNDKGYPVLTPADLNNLWLEAVEKDDRKLAKDIEDELLLRHKRGELSMADMEALSEGETEDEAAVLPTGQETAARQVDAAPAPAAAKQAGKKVPKGPVGSAWDKVVRQVAKANLQVPAWDTLTPEQRIKATDKYALNGKISLHEIQDVVGSTMPVVQKATPAPAPVATKIDEKSAATVAKVRKDKPPTIYEKPASTGADFMARLNEAAAKKKAGPTEEAPMVDKMEGDAPLTPREFTRRNVRERWPDEPINPKVKKLVDTLNDSGVYTLLSGDLYSDDVVYVDLDIPVAKLQDAKLPAGWKVHRTDVADTYVAHGIQEKLDPYFKDGLKGDYSPASLKKFGERLLSSAHPESLIALGHKGLITRLSRTGGAVTQEEADQLAAAVNAKLAEPKKKRPRLADAVKQRIEADKMTGTGAPKGWGRVEGDAERKAEENKIPQRPYAETEVRVRIIEGQKQSLVYSHVTNVREFFQAFEATRNLQRWLEEDKILHSLFSIHGITISEGTEATFGQLGGYGRRSDGVRVIEITSEALDNGQGDYVFAHELGHAVDLVIVPYTSNSPGKFSHRFDLELTTGASKKILMPVGPVAQEVFELYKNNPQWKFLRYPFDTSRYSLSNSSVKRELFAQLFAAYLIMPDAVKQDAPITARFMEKVFNEIRQTDYARELARAETRDRAISGESRPGGDDARVDRTTEDAAIPGGRAEAGREGRAQAGRRRLEAQAERAIAALPQASRTSAKRLWTTLADAAKKGLYGAAFTWDLADIAAKKLPSVTKYMGLMGKKAAVKTHLEDETEKILAQSERLPKTDRLGRAQTGTGEHSINKFLYDSTIQGKWGYKDDPASNIRVDPVMQERFNNFSDDAQALIKQIFKHGADTLRMKQRIIKDEINNEYRQLAKEAGQEPEKVAELERKRRAALQHYDSILFLTANKPYAPLRRFGNYAVVARSQQFRDAMANDNTKAIERMQADEDHYFVAFYETAGEAEAQRDRLQGTGKYVEASWFEKEKGLDAIHNGRDMLTAFNRLRNLIKSELETDPNDQVARSLNGMISDLYLQALAETSARKAEIKRRNVAGADLDMLRAFATQGRADAHFIAALKHNGEVTDAIYEMRREAHGAGDDKADRMRLFNEFMTRHALHMNYQEHRVQDAIMRGTSLWMLATSPAYYLQNATQTPMISVPYMAGKHGYGRSWSAISQAYKDLGPMSEGLNFSERMDLTKAPADVRRMLQDLVAAGRIDIALDQDLGRFQSRADNTLSHMWNTVDRKLRGMQQRVEAINRVTTAIAAYRMELARNGGNHAAATEYASKAIRITHGDYSAFNSPRYFTPGGGLPAAKVVTQFRKFQIIQASLIVRLFNNAFAGDVSPEERAIARKALAFTLGHTAAIGGVYGLPGASTLAWLVSKLLGDDDEPAIDELKLRRLIGNEDLADLVLKGAPAYFGLDLSGKLGMGNAFSVMPYANVTGFNRDSFEKGLLALTGPFVGGLLPRFADGIEQIARGNWYKGIEQLVPNGFGNAMKAYRFQNEGVTKRNGDVMLDAEEIEFGTTVLQALGLQTKQLTDRTFDQKVVADFEQFYKEKSARLTEKYAKAAKSGDTGAMGEAREQWMELQESRVRNGFTRQPLSQLLKAPANQAKREREVVNGVGTRRSGRRLAEELAEI